MIVATPNHERTTGETSLSGLCTIVVNADECMSWYFQFAIGCLHAADLFQKLCVLREFRHSRFQEHYIIRDARDLVSPAASTMSCMYAPLLSASFPIRYEES